MDQIQETRPGEAAVESKSRLRPGLWIGFGLILLLVLAAAAIIGLRSDSRAQETLRTLHAQGQELSERLRTLSAEGAARDTEIRDLEQQNAEKEALIRQLEDEEAQKTALAEESAAEHGRMDARMEELNAENAEKDTLIKERGADSARRANRIKVLTGEIDSAVLPEAPSPRAEEDAASAEAEAGPQPDAWGYVDEDGDGLILVPIKGKFTGYMLIVLDPSRVVLSCEPKMLGSHGYDVQHFVEKEGGVAGINGGSFADPGGRGDGSMPDTLIVSHGEIYCGGQGLGYYFTGIDDQYVLHVGVATAEEAKALHIQEGCCFRPGPILIKDGQMLPAEELVSGLNPRTAIGQRSDGAILLLVTEGRQPNRIGCSFQDAAELMLRFGAVNASNMDGGSSTMMWYEGQYINNRANVINVRYIPTSWVVLKEGRAGNG